MNGTNAMNGVLAGACEPVKLAPIPSAINHNRMAANRLHDQIDRLTVQLDGILTAQPPTTDAKAVDRASGVSQLHEELLSHGDSLNSVSARLDFILSRITI